MNIYLFYLNQYKSNVETIKNSNAVHIGIGTDTNDEINGTGRLETPSWSIDHIAHGDEQPTGWCCY